MRLLLLFIACALACHPECRWACDDPVCNATTSVVCQPSVCMIVCTEADDRLQCSNRTDLCSVRLPTEDACEMDECPRAETVCPSVSQVCRKPLGCQFLCEAPQCTWAVKKPSNCPRPRCELQCESPACVEPAISTASILLSVLVFSLQ